jgi:four helix bundle protein
VKGESYRDLLVWQRAMDLVAPSYALGKRLPANERFGLTSQIQRAAVSVPANIAEGHGRRHLGDYLHHLSIASGSLKELETHLLIAVRLGYLSEADLRPALQVSDEVGRMLTGLAQKLRTRQDGRAPYSASPKPTTYHLWPTGQHLHVCRSPPRDGAGIPHKALAPRLLP